MKVISIYCLFSLVAGASFSFATLVQEQHLTYEGAFRVPRGNLGGDSSIWSMGRGGKGITFNPARNTLILSGSSQEKYAIEISIPQPVNSSTISDLNTATTIQVPGNVAQGQWNNLNVDGSSVENGGRVGGFLVYNNYLVGNAYAYYASGDSAHLSHFKSALNWETVGSPYNFSGFKRVGVNPVSELNSNGGWTGGYMGHIPPEWQDRLGWPALTGNGATPVIGRSSLGPSVWGFDPDDIGVQNIAPAEIFFGYPEGHPTLATYAIGNSYYNMTANYVGVVFPVGSDSILFFGRIGRGENGDGAGCYGTGTSDESLHRLPVGDGSIYCYDPLDHDKGGHAYPYVAQVWAYDANDILPVKAGTLNYWEVEPYAIWTFNLPFTDEASSLTGKRELGGVAYDPSTQRIFISQLTSDHWADQYEPNPIIHVYSVSTSVSSSHASATPSATGTAAFGNFGAGTTTITFQ